MRVAHPIVAIVGLSIPIALGAGEARGVPVSGEVVDRATGKPLACRVYLHDAAGKWFFPASATEEGVAIPYRKQRADNPASVEMHTTLSAHPFRVDLPAGEYALTAERGKEYLPETQKFTVADEPVRLRVRLRRWIDLAERGWYSGETHVHRPVEELPTLLLAEDLNVAFPLRYWVTEAFTSPLKARDAPTRALAPRPIAVDPTHVIYPRNTEYEIFTVRGKRHTLGAFFALNHRTLLDVGVPPVKPVAERVHREGGLIELDKHNWPWSMALVPVMKADLYELTNNHVWRTAFGFPAFGEPAPEYMKIEKDDRGFTERGWIDYGLQNYYALLNCGFRLRPTAGTASGVHPVPLGFGRVYVHLPEGFSYEGWVKGLDAGRSVVTTGPMLFAEVNGKGPGETVKGEGKVECRVTGAALSPWPLKRIEVVVNGEVVASPEPANRGREQGGYESPVDVKIEAATSGWLAVRCFADLPEGRVRFAHTAPWHIEVPGKPLRPRKEEVEFLVRRVKEQLERSAEVLPAEALAEYREALRVYEELREDAR